MSKEIYKVILLGIMGALLAGYFYLNAYKINYVAGQYDMIADGKPADNVQILLNGDELVTYQVPASDIIDAQGSRHISFHALTAQQAARLTGENLGLTVMLNGENTFARLTGRPGYVILELPEQKLFLIADNYMENMAAILQHERLNRMDILACLDESLCRMLGVRLGEEWGPLEDPPLGSDMSRGRWSSGPAASLKLVAKMDVKVMVTFYMLTPFMNQEVKIHGPVLALFPIRLDKISSGPVDEKFYPRAFTVELQLNAGENDIKVVYSRWLDSSSGERPPLAAFVTGIDISGLI